MKKVFLCLVFPFFVNAQSVLITGNDTICDNGDPAVVKIDFTGTPPFTFIYAIDGINQPSISTTVNPYFIYTKTAGHYSISSCSDAFSFVDEPTGSAIVTIVESPVASIHLPSDTLSIIYSIANFVSQSVGDNILSWQWDFGDNTFDTIANPQHEYKYIGAYQVSLIVTDDNGCLDTAVNNIWVLNDFWIYIPNSFTPDAVGFNDKFCIEYNGIRENTFLFKVFNNQGDIIFQSTDSETMRCSMGKGWNGRSSDQDIDLPLDTYTYEVYFQDFSGWKHRDYGVIHLIR